MVWLHAEVGNNLANGLGNNLAKTALPLGNYLAKTPTPWGIIWQKTRSIGELLGTRHGETVQWLLCALWLWLCVEAQVPRTMLPRPRRPVARVCEPDHLSTFRSCLCPEMYLTLPTSTPQQPKQPPNHRFALVYHNGPTISKCLLCATLLLGTEKQDQYEAGDESPNVCKVGDASSLCIP